MIAPNDLREIIRHGLLSFPVTPFDAQDALQRHLSKRISNGCRNIRLRG